MRAKPNYRRDIRNAALLRVPERTEGGRNWFADRNGPTARAPVSRADGQRRLAVTEKSRANGKNVEFAVCADAPLQVVAGKAVAVVVV